MFRQIILTVKKLILSNELSLYDVLQYSTVLLHTMQYTRVLYDTLQYCTVLYDK